MTTFAPPILGGLSSKNVASDKIDSLHFDVLRKYLSLDNTGKIDGNRSWIRSKGSLKKVFRL